MADITIGRLRGYGARAPVLDRAIDLVLEHASEAVLVSIMVLAAALRFWGLGHMALHHDESLHSEFSYYLYNGAGYKHDPLMHGPFLFHANTAIFFLFGDSEYTTRILPALFGTVLVGMPYLLKKQLGMRAVLLAALMLTFSPSLLYISRFIRDDIYICVWTFGLVICMWRYLDEQKPLYLYALAALLAMSFATMELTFITAAIMLVFIDALLAIELSKPVNGQRMSKEDRAVKTLVILPVAWLIAAAWPLMGSKPFGRDRLPPVGDLMVLIGVLVLPQFSAGIQHFPGFHDHGYNVPQERTLRDATVIILMLISAYVGLIWRPRVFLICAAAFYVPFVLFYTTFFTNPAGFWSGMWGSLDYWLAQQGERRGNQPQYYYGLMTPLYEFLPMLATLAGGLWLILKGDSFKRWLVFWLFGIFVGLSLAGEKMPWLETHIALPLVLCAAVIIARASENLGIDGEKLKPALATAVLTGAGVFMVVDGSGVVRILGLFLFCTLAAWLGASYSKEGKLGVGRVALTVAFAALLTLTGRASIIMAFHHDDVPVEMLVYTQTSHDVVDLRDRIDALAKASGMGYNLPIVVDPTDGYAWPWAWYLRHYHDVRYTTPNAPGFRGPEGAVLLVHQSDVTNVDAGQYSQTPYKHRWWFNETYRGLTPGKAISQLTHTKSLEALGKFFLYRRNAATTTGSVNGVAFFPDSLAAYDKLSSISKPPSEPVMNVDGRTTVGKAGSGRGDFLVPTGITVDSEGNIWVADSRNNRIQKFDSSGHFIAVLGHSGSGAGEFNEPWSVAVDSEGYIYVADTWNHRVQRFSPDLKPIALWGQPSVNPVPGPLDLFGPRDIAIDADGTLWLTDTGNKRLVHYTKTGEPLGVFGSEGTQPGQFQEPTGITRDANGRFLIADAWNGRIQRIDAATLDNPAAGTSGASSFAAPWTSHDILDKPYVAVLKDGRILTTDPEKGEIVLFDANGGRLGAWKPDSDAQPIGVAALADGGFVYTDARRNQVQIVPAALLDRLFK